MPEPPRKRPLQSRSRATVEALHEATVQVLARGGPGAATTTRIAERAGVSVGTLYQYFPDRLSLLADVYDRRAGEAVDALADALADVGPDGDAPRRLAGRLVDAYVAAKTARTDVSRALYALPLELGQDEVVARHVARAVESIAGALERLPGRLRVPAHEAAALVAATVQEPVRALVLAGATPDASARLARALSTMIAAYVADVVDGT